MRRNPGGAILTMLASAALLWGCGDDNGTKPDGEGLTPITIPLAVGNSWYYSTEVTSTSTETYTDTTKVIDTQVYEGETYAVLVEQSAGEPETTLVRQDKHALYIIPSESDSKRAGGTLFLAIAAQEFEETYPWKVADFSASSGTSWIVAQVDTLIPMGNETVGVRYTVEATSRGRTTLSVPAGDFTDVHHGELTVTVRLDMEPPFEMVPIRQELWIADGVGVIREVAVVDEDPYDLIVETTTSELTSYDVD